MTENTIISPYPERFKKTAGVFAIVVFLTGVAVLIGWQFDITALKSIFPGIVNMNPLTAICFLLISSIIIVINKGSIGRIYRLVMYSVLVFVCLVAISRFIHIFGGIDLGLDQIFFREKLLNVSIQFSKNRIAPNTALNLILVSFSLFHLIRGKKYGMAYMWGFLTFSISLFAILGYAYSVKNLYGFLAYTPMALNTACCFFLISLCLFLTTPTEGIMKIVSSTSPAGITARRLIPLVVILPAFLGWLRVYGANNGWFGTEFGLALLIIILIMIFLSILVALLHKLNIVDQAKTEFVSLASHQLRTPLSAINWYSEMLLSDDAGKLNPQQKEFVDEIAHGNKRMVQLVNSLLNVSRIDLGTFAVEPEPTDLGEILKSVLEELKPHIVDKKIIVKLTCPNDLPVAHVDPKLVRIVIQNLLSNAVKYNREGGTIEVLLSEDKDSMYLTVSDTGFGIPKKQQNKMFTKLFRADNVTVKAIEGTGLGMYVVKAIIEQFKGEIAFTSEEDKGTTFTVKLPIVGVTKKEGQRGLV